MKRMMQQAYVVGRRDFVATVWSRTFLFFLVGPLLIIGISFGFGNVSEQMVRAEVQPHVAVIAPQAEYEAVRQSRERLSQAFREDELPELTYAEPDYNLDQQTERLLASRDERIVAVLSGLPDRPKLTGTVSETGSIRSQVTLMLEDLRKNRALAAAGLRVPPVEVELVRVEESGGTVSAMRAMTARAAQLLLFMLTVFLSTMLLSNLIEEKSSKVIEVLAAAVPIDAIFVGKLFAMLAVSMVGIVVWTAAVIACLIAWPGTGTSLPEPAVGWTLFAILVLIYYSTNYLLLGALFLGIGSQATSVREVQTLSMPVTIGQMLVFFFALFAVGPYNSVLGISAAVFPFSSPLAMIARAAQTPELWTHLLALAWQLLWLWLVIALSASLFRSNVLKSGEATDKPRKSRVWNR